MKNKVFKPSLPILLSTTLAALTLSAVSHADVDISQGWVRATAPGQSVGAAYLTMRSPQSVQLVFAETERAGQVEMHSMRMEKGVMKMRSLDSLPIPAGQSVSLGPGGLHLMLFDLPSPLKTGERVQFRLCFKDAQGKITDQFVTLPVKTAP